MGFRFGTIKSPMMMKRIFLWWIVLFWIPKLTMSQCWTQVSAGDYHTVALRKHTSDANRKTVWAFGFNGFGAMGTGANSNQPAVVGSHETWVKVASGLAQTLAIRQDGTLWGWGYNGKGQLGNGSYTNESTPAQIGNATWTDVVVTSAGHAAGIQTNGSLWTWGENLLGTLGVGNTTNTNSPTQVAGSWRKVAVGNTHTVALKTDGTLWAWGNNNDGQLGAGNSVGQSLSPRQVGAATDWVDITAGWAHNLAIKADGSLWAWGYNSSGQLGDGSTTTRFEPVKIGTATDWRTVSSFEYHNLALKTDGSLWTWGFNGSGQLGDGTTTPRLAPAPVGNLKTWTQISAGRNHSAALQTDGTLWVWGNNSNGQLGLGQTSVGTNVLTAQQVTCPGGSVATEDEHPTVYAIDVYPNPSQGVFRVHVQDDQPATLRVYSMLGRLVWQADQVSGTQTLHLTGLAKGVYNLHVSTRNGAQTERLVIR